MAKPLEIREKNLGTYTFRWERHSDGSRLLSKIHTRTLRTIRSTAYTAEEIGLIEFWERVHTSRSHNNPGLAQGI